MNSTAAAPRADTLHCFLTIRLPHGRKLPPKGVGFTNPLYGTLKQADHILRLVGSLKLGWVTASLIINKFQSYKRQSALVKALQEYGRLNKTIFILRYILDEAYQRRIGKQLNKGEALHDLRAFLMFAREGQIKLSQLENQENQANCLTLVTNAVIIWNTVYMEKAIAELKSEGVEISDQDLAHLSPCRYEHITNTETTSSMSKKHLPKIV